MISFLSRICLLIVLVNLLACTNASSEQQQESEPIDGTTHFNDSTEAA